MIKTTLHKINDNRLKVNNESYTWINGGKIIVGVENPDEHQILTDANGYNYSRTAVEAQEIYNKATQRRSAWFMLDLETGVNPHRYFPGCEIHGSIPGNDIQVKESPSEDSLTVAELTMVRVVITNISTWDENPPNDYYEIRYSDIHGFVHKSYIADVVYEAPFK